MRLQASRLHATRLSTAYCSARQGQCGCRGAGGALQRPSCLASHEKSTLYTKPTQKKAYTTRQNANQQRWLSTTDVCAMPVAPAPAMPHAALYKATNVWMQVACTQFSSLAVCCDGAGTGPSPYSGAVVEVLGEHTRQHTSTHACALHHCD